MHETGPAEAEWKIGWENAIRLADELGDDPVLAARSLSEIAGDLAAGCEVRAGELGDSPLASRAQAMSLLLTWRMHRSTPPARGGFAAQLLVAGIRDVACDLEAGHLAGRLAWPPRRTPVPPAHIANRELRRRLRAAGDDPDAQALFDLAAISLALAARAAERAGAGELAADCWLGLAMANALPQWIEHRPTLRGWLAARLEQMATELEGKQ